MVLKQDCTESPVCPYAKQVAFVRSNMIGTMGSTVSK